MSVSPVEWRSKHGPSIQLLVVPEIPWLRVLSMEDDTRTPHTGCIDDTRRAKNGPELFGVQFEVRGKRDLNTINKPISVHFY